MPQVALTAVASSSAITPAGDGGELIQAKKAGWPLPVGYGAMARSTNSSREPSSCPSCGNDPVAMAWRCPGGIGRVTGRCRIPSR